MAPQSSIRRLLIAATAATVVIGSSLIATGAATAAPAHGLQPVSSATSSASGGDYTDQLEKLVGTQSPNEIHAIATSGGKVQVLVDSSTGKVIAALKPATNPFTGMALSPVGPGCTLTSLCMKTTSNLPYGYTGTGSLSGTWSPIHSVTGGDHAARFTQSSGLRIAYAAGVTATYTTSVTIVLIERS